MNSHNQIKRRIGLNSLGVLFYSLALMLWLWAIVPFLPFILDFVDSMQASDSEPISAPEFTISLPQPVLIIIGVLAVLLVTAATIYAFVKTPPAIGKTGHAIAKASTKKVTMSLPAYQTMPVQEKRKLTARLMVAMKVALVLVPLLISALSYAAPLLASYEATIIASTVLCGLALFTLGLQLVAAKLLRVPFDKIW